MTLDDLAKAAYEKATVTIKAEPMAWQENTEEGRWLFRQIALAVAEKVLEMADAKLAANMEGYEAASVEAEDDTAVSDYEQLYMAAREARDVLKEIGEGLKGSGT